jgi:two-component sensor histidine kinase
VAAGLSIAWREIGGPAVAPSPQGKYGVSIIRKLIPHELGGSVDLTFAPGGVCCTIELPAEAVLDQPTGKLLAAASASLPPHARQDELR